MGSPWGGSSRDDREVTEMFSREDVWKLYLSVSYLSNWFLVSDYMVNVEVRIDRKHVIKVTIGLLNIFITLIYTVKSFFFKITE